MMATENAINTQRSIKLEDSWKKLLFEEFGESYMQSLRQFLFDEKAKGKRIFPPGEEIFNALNTTAFDNANVVILGQDPYHGARQAHGLCFSVKPGIEIPPSLVNIYKELETDLGFMRPTHGCLTYWAEQGVLLLNAVLTVESGRAGSHQGKGWERFTDKIIALLNENKRGIVFILWGSYAQKKGAIIDRQKHMVLQSSHPSPLSASKGFFGNHHFSKTNDYLKSQGKASIDWQLPQNC